MPLRDKSERKDSVLFCFKSQIRVRGTVLYSEALEFSLRFVTHLLCSWVSHFLLRLNFLFCKMKMIIRTLFLSKREGDGFYPLSHINTRCVCDLRKSIPQVSHIKQKFS